MSDAIKCLVVRQPWAWALVAGAKNIENRSWTTGYRGPIVIQAGLPKTVVNEVTKSSEAALPRMDFEYGALVGVIDLIDVVPLDESLESNPWAWGPYCWKVGNARRFLKAIPAKGKLKLYSLEAELAQRASAAMATAEAVELSSDAQTWIDAITQFGGDERSRYEGLKNSYIELDDDDNRFRLAEYAVAKWGDADAVLDRSLSKYLAEDYDGALDDANHAVKIAPNLARAYLIRSWVLYRLDNVELAERDRVKVEELDPELAESSYENEQDQDD